MFVTQVTFLRHRFCNFIHMRRISYLIYTLLISLCASIQAQQVSNAKFNQMLSKLLDHSVTEIGPNNIKEEAIFLDAREIEEFQVSHLPNAIHVGYDYFNIQKWKYLINKKKPIIVYCTVGYRSEKIAEQLQRNGFKNVKNLYGGIFEWVHQNNPLHCNKKHTDSVHTFNKEWSQWLQKGIKVY